MLEAQHNTSDVSQKKPSKKGSNIELYNFLAPFPFYALKWNFFCDNQCRTQHFSVFVFSDSEISQKDPLVCVAKGQKELVECKTSGKKTYRR